jgi:MFS transporter, FSR family, fosmidomycin resistance protein
MNIKILLILSFGHLATDIYQGALPAILPLLKAKLSLSYTMAGVVLMAANVSSSILQPLFGYLSDRKEKAVLLPLGCLTAGAGLALLAVPDQLWLVLVLVLISGLGVAAYHPEGYKTAHFFTGQQMATGMSVFSVGGNLGLALGPILSLSVVSLLGFQALPVMFVFALLAVLLFASFWPDITAAKTMPAPGAAQSTASSQTAYLPLMLTIGTVIMRSWTQLGLMTYIPFYYLDYLGGDPVFSGTLVSSFLLGGVAGTIVGSIMADRWGHKRFLIWSLVLTCLFFPLIFVAPGLFLFGVLTLVGLTLISSFTVTIVMAQRLLPRNLGIASGLMVGFAIGTGGLGVTLMGLIADRFGVAYALKSLMLLPLTGLALSLLIRYPPETKNQGPG